MRKLSLLSMVAVFVITSPALAASIDGRLGVTGKAGALVPLQDRFVSSTSESKAGIAYGGGLIYGFGKNFAAEVDVTHAPQLDVDLGSNKAFDAALTDVAVGIQYRLAGENRLVPFFGIGADFIKGSLKHSVSNANYDLDWTEGGHVSAGLDYFVARGIAFSVEGRFLFAFDGDIRSAGATVGKYDPTSFVGTVGIRLMLPESAFW